MNPALVNVASRGFRYPEQYRVQYTGTYTDARNNTERATLVAFAKCAHEPNTYLPPRGDTLKTIMAPSRTTPYNDQSPGPSLKVE